MNYIKAIREFLQNDIDMIAYTTNINRVRADKDNSDLPMIIFSEWPKENQYWNQMWRKWIDVFPVTFECIVKYEDSIKGREIRELLKFKLNGRNIVSVDRNGDITNLNDDGIWYDDQKDIVNFSTTFLFKNKYDHTTKRTI